MTRINTNVSSLVAQKTLARTNMDLQTSLTRLSTGLRINTGKDDPAGLIASEALRTDIISVESAISNSERANQVIATADSALGQVSILLNDIRGLVTEAANTGAMSDDQIAANQLQIDSSLEAINRIAQTTSFQGRKLLDGSLDFVTTAGSGFANITDLQIDQANLGTTGAVAVDINVATAATQAQLTTTVTNSSAAVEATTRLTFAQGDYIDIVADTAGSAANGITVQIVEDASVEDGSAIAFYDETNSLITVRVDNTAVTAMSAIESALQGVSVLDSVATAYTQNGAADTDYTPAAESNVSGVLGDVVAGADAVAGLEADLVFELRGSKGSELFNFAEGTTADDVAAAIELVKDSTGVGASYNAGTNTLSLTSVDYGSSSLVEVDVISETGSATTFSDNLQNAAGAATRDIGEDIVATVNGTTASGAGNALSINTSTLDLTATISAGQTGSMQFTISGGGALFQIGPDVVSNQQVRIGVGSVNSASLGGASGRLYQLGSGESADLDSDATTAYQIIEEVSTKITGLRGRLGAFQKTTLESNIFTLNETVANLTEAESAIRDADFAAETAALTRAQILVQSGMSVLSIANSNPQNVLALLR
jgi:flagellin